MQVGRCCQCGGGTSPEGYYARLVSITSATLTDIGTETGTWTVSTSSSKITSVAVSTSSWSLDETRLMRGIRLLSIPFTNEAAIHNIRPDIVGTNYFDPFLTSDFDLDSFAAFNNTYLGYGMALTVIPHSPTHNGCYSANHILQSRISSLLLPITMSLSQATTLDSDITSYLQSRALSKRFQFAKPKSHFINCAARIKYFRLLSDSSPITDIIPVTFSSETEWVFPELETASLSTTNSTSGKNVNYCSLVNKVGIDDSRYFYSENNATFNAPLIAPNIKNIGNTRSIVVRLRLCKVNNGALTDSSDSSGTLNVRFILSVAGSGGGSAQLLNTIITVPNVPTDFTFNLSSITNAINTGFVNYSFTFNVSSNTSGRGVAVLQAGFTYTKGWENRWNLSDQNTSSFDISDQPNMPVFQKNTNYGIDVWFEIMKTNSTAQTVTIGHTTPSNVNTSVLSPVGVGGLGVEMNRGFNRDRQTYEIEFDNGVYRPIYVLEDTYLNEKDFPDPYVIRNEVYREITPTFYGFSSYRDYVSNFGFQTADTIQSGQYTYGTNLLLSWNKEVPILLMGDAMYQPENIDTANISTLRSSSTYFYAQDTPGEWNRTSTVFKYVHKLQTNSTNSFTDKPLPTFLPSTITVRKKPHDNKRTRVMIIGGIPGFPLSGTELAATAFAPNYLGAYKVTIELWAPGGTAGTQKIIPTGPYAGFFDDTWFSASSGGGGAYAKKTFTMFYDCRYVAVTPGIADMLSGGTTTTGASMVDGQDAPNAEYYLGYIDPTTLILSAAGGKGGMKADSTNPTTAALGGQASDCYGYDVAYSGGNGSLASAHPTTGLLIHPVGGGSAGSNANGNAATWITRGVSPSITYELNPIAVRHGSGTADDDISLTHYSADQFTHGKGGPIMSTTVRGNGNGLIRATMEMAGDRHITFTQSGTWICPAGLTVITLYGVAPGAGGGGCDSDSTSNAGGGGGGCYGTSLVSVTPGKVYTVVIGEEGLGGLPGENGTDAGNVLLKDGDTVLFKVVGGKGGFGAVSGAYGSGGLAGAASECVADTAYSGGNGTSGGNLYSGGGGSAGGRFSNGFTSTSSTLLNGDVVFSKGGRILYYFQDSFGRGGDGCNRSKPLPDSPKDILTGHVYGGGGGGAGLGGNIPGADGGKGYLTIQWEW